MKPFLSGRQSADGTSSPGTSPGGAARTGIAALGAVRCEAQSAGAQVDVIKQGDKVTRLIVTCSCGERIEIDCLYPAGR